MDLASAAIGGTVMAASDEAFGEKEYLLSPAATGFVPGRYGPRGEIVDGWETRRRRVPGHDWALVRLGTAGVIASIDVDTTSFTGNHPAYCSVEACGVEGYPSPEEMDDEGAGWTEIVARSPLQGDAHNLFEITDARRFTHVRLSIYPDGGVARLRVLGLAVADPRLLDGLSIDLAAAEHGGIVVASSDEFYTTARTLNLPDRARSMGEGWETRRRRDGAGDAVLFRLAFPGHIRQVVVDTTHFRYNASAEVELHGLPDPIRGTGPPPESADWRPLVGRVRLQPDTGHVFPVAAGPAGPALSWVRLRAFPDGGLARVRLLGVLDAAGRRDAGYRWFNLLPAPQARACLIGIGLPPGAAEAVVEDRPIGPWWIQHQLEVAGGIPSPWIEQLATVLEGPDRP